MISNLIHIFLKNFNYLNSKGKRGGLILFSNNKLTGDLEKEAQRMKGLIDDIVKNQTTNDEITLQQFIAALRQCFENVKDLRKTHAPIETVLAYAPSGNDPYSIYYTRDKTKMPYAPSKFEGEIVEGLKAALAEAEEEKLKFSDSKDILTSFIEQCTQLKSDILGYSPKEIMVEKGTRLEQGDPYPHYGLMM